ncbi:MAG: hypothetical protein GXP49_14515, partial [Deltaproteobacteria bacterium]|nr:hypothetical protein [Deltaproteobacteria bacterium]
MAGLKISRIFFSLFFLSLFPMVQLGACTSDKIPSGDTDVDTDTDTDADT